MWTKHFTVASTSLTPVPMAIADEKASAGTSSKYASYLPEVYAGHPNRIQRYSQYADMDRDSDINAALDTIADFCTQSEEQNDEPFEVVYNDDANETEITLIKTNLKLWVKLNNFKQRLWHIFRQTVMNGDQFFLRDPETAEWLWIDHYKVEMVKIDDNKTKEADEYIIRGLELNRQAQFATRAADPSQYRTPNGTSLVPGVRPQINSGSSSTTSNIFQMAGASKDQRSQQTGQTLNELSVVDADHVVHLSLSVGMDPDWPFGRSILEPIFKTYKQKELLEDSIIIYRVQRAPERRIFYIDVGTMPAVRAKMHIEQVKNEIHQRRIPNRTGGGASIMDAAYNPLSIVEDYFFAQSAEGRGSKVETLPGGDNLGEIGDLTFFTKKMARGLRIPASYLSLGDDDSNGGAAYNDGKLGAAVIQEFRFNKYCMRLQSLLVPAFDKDFKRFLKDNGIEIESNLFELKFNPPQNFTKYRQIELDSAQMSVYQMVQDNKKIAERMKFKKYLNWNDEDILENEKMWAEENPEKFEKATGSSPTDDEPGGDLSSVGIRMPDGGGMDMGDMDDMGDMGDMPPEEGGAPGGPQGGQGGAPPPPPAGGQPPL